MYNEKARSHLTFNYQLIFDDAVTEGKLYRLKMVNNEDLAYEKYVDYPVDIVKYKKGFTTDPDDNNELWRMYVDWNGFADPPTNQVGQLAAFTGVAQPKFCQEYLETDMKCWEEDADCSSVSTPKDAPYDSCPRIELPIVPQLPPTNDVGTITIITRNGDELSFERSILPVSDGGNENEWYGEDNIGNILHYLQDDSGIVIGSLFDLISSEVSYFYNENNDINEQVTLTGSELSTAILGAPLQVDGESINDFDDFSQTSGRRLASSANQGTATKYFDIIIGWTGRAACTNYCKASSFVNKFFCLQECRSSKDKCSGSGKYHDRMVKDIEKQVALANQGLAQGGVHARLNVVHTFCNKSYQERAPRRISNVINDISNPTYKIRLAANTDLCVGSIVDRLFIKECNATSRTSSSDLYWRKVGGSNTTLLRPEESQLCVKKAFLFNDMVLGSCRESLGFDQDGNLEVKLLGREDRCWQASRLQAGSPILAKECDSTNDRQKFDFGGGYVQIKPFANANRWLCLADPGPPFPANNVITLRECSPDGTMSWRANAIPSDKGFLLRSFSDPAKCMALDSSSNLIRYVTCDPQNPLHLFEFLAKKRQFKNYGSNNCIEFSSSSSSLENTPVTYSPCDGSDTQRFRFAKGPSPIDGLGLGNTVDALRTEYRADLVHFMVSEGDGGTFSSGGATGKGWINVPAVGKQPIKKYGFSVSVPTLEMSEKHGMFHEIGHTLGCYHDRGTADEDKSVTGACASKNQTNFGYRVWTDPSKQGGNCDFRTLMAYECEYSSRNRQCDYVAGKSGTSELALPKFSNPNVSHKGRAGKRVIGDKENNNALQINTYRTVISDFECSVGSEGKFTLFVKESFLTDPQILPKRWTVYSSKGVGVSFELKPLDWTIISNEPGSPGFAAKAEIILPDDFGCVEEHVMLEAASSVPFSPAVIRMDSVDLKLTFDDGTGIIVVSRPFTPPYLSPNYHDVWKIDRRCNPEKSGPRECDSSVTPLDPVCYNTNPSTPFCQGDVCIPCGELLNGSPDSLCADLGFAVCNVDSGECVK
mmetsp:Transcript_7979/g.17856  ORF Transcript_7979/g.17856 Transcript_7979/m.17856 type:complete len:1048 (-) Transcript_7979:120-3263(-)